MATNSGCMILMSGLPGTGKSTLARALADRLGGIVLDKDEIRAALFPAPLIEYSQRQDDFCMRVLLDTAEYLLQHSGVNCLFIDGRPFVLRSQIDEAARAAERLSCDLAIIHTTCSEQTARGRLSEQHLAGNRDINLYTRLREKMETIERPHLRIDTDLPLETCVARSLDYLVTMGGRHDCTLSHP